MRVCWKSSQGVGTNMDFTVRPAAAPVQKKAGRLTGEHPSPRSGSEEELLRVEDGPEDVLQPLPAIRHRRDVGQHRLQLVGSRLAAERPQEQLRDQSTVLLRGEFR